MRTPGSTVWVGLLVAGFLGLGSAADAKVVFVAKTGNDANDGLSWGTARLTVQAGLNAAVADDEVWVAAGTYVETITLRTGIPLYGGFAGNETDRTLRDWKVNETILDGNAAGNVVTYAPQVDAPTRIDGFTIRNGKASDRGGGILCFGSDLTIANNTIVENTSSDWGGGICCYGASPAIINNTIGQNAAMYGGGIHCDMGAKPTIAGNTITGNTASSEGGGICCSCSSPIISDNTIANNRSYRGGGVAFDQSIDLVGATLTRNVITGNILSRSSGQGGGVYCYRSPVRIAGNTISENVASDSGCDGGGIYSDSSKLTIEGNRIAGNRLAYDSESRGGGIYCDDGTVTIVNNVITGNVASLYTSGYGGGIYASRASLTIANNTITGNLASDGGGVYCRTNTPWTIVNTIVALNSSGILGSSTSATPVIRSSCVHGNSSYDVSGVGFVPGLDGNISADPKLAGIAYGNLHIQPDSPCKDAGDDAQVQTGWTDVDGQARIQGSHVDMGADESDGTEWSPGPYIIARVSPDGDDTNGGLSWSTAKRTVQAGIDLAHALGGEVWVKAGTYEERIVLHPYAHAYGGFRGTETLRDQRDWRTQVTILDGQAGGSVVTVLSGEQVSTIDGFTIRNGKASAGGGIYCEYASPMIANNTITGNTLTDEWGGGGGVCCWYSSATIVNNRISENTISSGGVGGGVYCSESSAKVLNNTISRNSAGSGYGGGINCNRGTTSVIANTITGNDASCGAGIACGSSTGIIANNVIAGNAASGSWAAGGGIWCEGVSPLIADNTIVGNSCPESRNLGGGIFCSYAGPLIVNTIVAWNSSGIFSSPGPVPAIRYSCVYGNTAYNYSGVPDATGNSGTISGDPLFVRAAGPGDDGVWGTADDDMGDLHLRAGSPCIDAGDNGAVPAGILSDLDGLFRFFNDPATADTGLGAVPIVDMGAYEYLPGDFDRDGDIDADDMEVFVTCVSGPSVRYAGDCAAADFNRDGDVDQSDFGFIQRCFSGAGKVVDPGCGG